MHLGRLALVALAALVTPALAQDQDPAVELLERAKQRIAQKDYPGALDLLGRALSLAPTNEVAHYLRGQTRHLSGDLEGALVDYGAALDLVPGYHQAIHNRGVAYHALGRFEEAAADFAELIRIKPDRADAYYMRAAALLRLGEEGEAIADCTMAIRLKKDYPQAFSLRANAHMRAHDFAAAAADLAQACALTPQSASLQLNLALAARHAGELERARDAYARAIELSGEGAPSPLAPLDLGRAHSGRGQVLLLLGDREGGVAELRKGVELQPEFVYMALWLALVTGEPESLARVTPEGDFTDALLAFASGELTADALLAKADVELEDDRPRSRAGRVCQAHCYIALEREQAGDAAGAKRHYEAAAATEAKLFLEHQWARAKLAAASEER